MYNIYTTFRIFKTLHIFSMYIHICARYVNMYIYLSIIVVVYIIKYKFKESCSKVNNSTAFFITCLFSKYIIRKPYNMLQYTRDVHLMLPVLLWMLVNYIQSPHYMKGPLHVVINNAGSFLVNINIIHTTLYGIYCFMRIRCKHLTTCVNTTFLLRICI